MAAELLSSDYASAALPAVPARVRSFYLVAALLALAVIPTLFLDLTVTRYFFELDRSGGGELRKAISLFEAFGHGVGVGVIIIAVAVLDRQRFTAARRLIVCAFGAGLVNLVAKLLVGRSRPQVFWATEFPETTRATFRGFAMLFTGEWADAFRHSLQSFPSGHSATAAGLAVGLTWLYPRGRYLFAALAALAMLQRIQCGAHFPSDTLAGAALGVTVATICCDPRFLGRHFQQRSKSDCLAERAAID
jgi:membrane-associated phospholipid phosphatase